MNIRRLSSRLIAYAWAAPNTALGLAVGLVLLCLGGRLHFVAGVAEFHGGWLGRIVASLPDPVCFGAMTLGHVIVGIHQATLCELREHEQVHVRQYEQWGLFFLPAYALSSLWQVVNGRSAHGSNFFESVGGPMGNQPELPREGFALWHRLITRIGLARTSDEAGRIHGPDIELAQVARRLDAKVAPVALPVLHGLVMATHCKTRLLAWLPEKKEAH